jgi:predicted MPP superfamily phosphohydrolase
MIKRFHIGLGILATVILLGIIIVGISALVCYYCLAVHEYDVHIDGIEHPFTAVVLTDLHSREFGEDNETLLVKIREQKPDVIFSLAI